MSLTNGWTGTIKEPRYIDANEIKYTNIPVPGLGNLHMPDIENAKTAVVLCKNCKYADVNYELMSIRCTLWDFETEYYGFCHKGRTRLETYT